MGWPVNKGLPFASLCLNSGKTWKDNTDQVLDHTRSADAPASQEYRFAVRLMAWPTHFHRYPCCVHSSNASIVIRRELTSRFPDVDAASISDTAPRMDPGLSYHPASLRTRSVIDG